ANASLTMKETGTSQTKEAPAPQQPVAPEHTQAIVSASEPPALAPDAPGPQPWQFNWPFHVGRGFHRWLDTVNKLFQIAALIVAGIWAWNVFELTVKPGLETKFPINTDVHWAKVPETDVCQSRFEVTVKNDGQSPFDITDVTTSGWIVDLEKERLLATKDDA